MSKDKKKLIKLHSLFGSSISTRQAVEEIARKAERSSDVVLDFCDITFVSRSFAHELLRFQDEFKAKVTLKNIQPAVQKFLDIVKQARLSSNETDEEIEITETSAILSDPTVNF